VGGECVGDGWQPAQRTDAFGGRSWGWLQPPVEHRGDVDGIAQGGRGGLVQGVDGVVAFDGLKGEVTSQDRPGRVVGDVGADCGGGGVDVGHGGRAGGVFGGRGERVGVHGGRRVQAAERVGFGGRGAVGRDLCAVAAQDRREDVYCCRRVGGFGCEDAMGVSFGGGKVDVVLVLSAGDGDVELLAGEPIGGDDVAGAFDVAAAGGHALGAVDGGCVAQGGVGGDVVSGQAHGLVLGAPAQRRHRYRAVPVDAADDPSVAVFHPSFAAGEA
jgi:hypothetical protein